LSFPEFSFGEKKKNKLPIGWAFRDVSTDKPLNIPGQFHMQLVEATVKILKKLHAKE